MKLDLPNTCYVVLGLLAGREALSGYEVRKRAGHLKHFYWSPAQSQIYRELRRLEEQAFVTSYHVAQSDKPNKQMFEITDAGVEVFRYWLNHADLPATVTKHPVLLKLHFGQFAETSSQISMLRGFIENTEQNLAQLYVVEEFLEAEEDAEVSSMVLEWSIHHQKSELEMAKTLLKRFEDMN